MQSTRPADVRISGFTFVSESHPYRPCREAFYNPRTKEWDLCAHPSHYTLPNGGQESEDERRLRIQTVVVPRLLEREGKPAESPIAVAPAPSSPSEDLPVGPSCLCECGGVTKGGKFLPGHDARLRGRLTKIVNNPELSREERMVAYETVHSHGWTQYVKDEVKAELGI